MGISARKYLAASSCHPSHPSLRTPSLQQPKRASFQSGLDQARLSSSSGQPLEPLEATTTPVKRAQIPLTRVLSLTNRIQEATRPYPKPSRTRERSSETTPVQKSPARAQISKRVSPGESDGKQSSAWHRMKRLIRPAMEQRCLAERQETSAYQFNLLSGRR